MIIFNILNSILLRIWKNLHDLLTSTEEFKETNRIFLIIIIIINNEMFFILGFEFFATYLTKSL